MFFFSLIKIDFN